MKAVIFDFDGVILDSEPQHYASFFELFRRLGLECRETPQTLSGRSGKDNIRRVLQYNRASKRFDVAQLSAMRDGIFLEIVAKDVRPMPGALKLVSSLDQEKIPLALASSSSMKVLRFLLPKLGLERAFSVVVSGFDVARGKPAPDLFLQAAEKLRVGPSECVVIEDSNAGVQAANEAGMKVLMVKNPHVRQDAKKADAFVESLEAVTPGFLARL